MKCTWSFRHRWGVWEDCDVRVKWTPRDYIALPPSEGWKPNEDVVAGQQRQCLRCKIIEIRRNGEPVK